MKFRNLSGFPHPTPNVEKCEPVSKHITRCAFGSASVWRAPKYCSHKGLQIPFLGPGKSNTPPSLCSSQEWLYVSFLFSLIFPAFLWRSLLAPTMRAFLLAHFLSTKKDQGIEHPKRMCLSFHLNGFFPKELARLFKKTHHV